MSKKRYEVRIVEEKEDKSLFFNLKQAKLF